MQKNAQQRKLYDTDTLMKGLWLHLWRDFGATCPGLQDDLRADKNFVESNSIAQYRTLEKGTYYLSEYYYFKCRYQMDSLFKRYRFEKDLYSDKELERITFQKFLDTQHRISIPHIETQRSSLVLERARSIIANVLGEYDEGVHRALCRFGKRASVGNPRRTSYLDVKLGALTGSLDHIEWFKDHLTQDTILRDAIVACSKEPRYTVCDALVATAVPKSFKALRLILANTTIGSFYTYGLGKYIQRKLTSVGLHIPKLQGKHRRWVLKYSKNLKCATGDLSSASDSFAEWHFRALLPKDWFEALIFGRIAKVKIGSTIHPMASMMTMGVGYTFQLQTLFFYGILKAIQDLSGISGRISVYGDDLIYPSKMHGYVSQIFTDIGFILNKDKTFVYQSFRESCGSDGYCGIDVRPFQPEGQHQKVRARQYELLLYKTINGLLLRWEECEISSTIRFLKLELLRVASVIFQVPPSFPATAGIRVEVPSMDYLYPWAEVKHKGNFVYSFAYLQEYPRDRFVPCQYPFFWNAMRAKSTIDEVEEIKVIDPERALKLIRERAFLRRLGVVLPRSNESILDSVGLNWSKTGKDGQMEYIWSKVQKGKRFVKLHPIVPDKERPPELRRCKATSLEWT